MNKLLKSLALAALAATAFLGSAIAVPIYGTIQIASYADNVIVDQANFKVSIISLLDSDPSNDALNAIVNGTSGDYTSIALDTLVAYSDFTYNPLPSGGITPLWDIGGGFASFNLTAVTYYFHGPNNFLYVEGTGTAYLTGKDPTDGSWQFSAQGGQGEFSFSSTTSVPDTGMTAILLGLGLLATVIAVRRKVA